VIWPLDRWMAVPTGGREARVSSTALRAATWRFTWANGRARAQ
jgi:hypothetical protein